MSINRENWLRASFRKDDVPAWPCPTCNSGMLLVAQGKHGPLINAVHTRACLRDRGEPWYSYYEDDGMFSAMLRCSRSGCGDYVSLCGVYFTDQDFDERGGDHPAEAYMPRFFYPTVRVFQPPKKCPENIAKEIEAAFRVYWCDTAACLNHIRCTIEMLLTHIGVRQFSKPGKKGRLTLDARINELPARYDSFKNSLHAVRWLGNAGSHADDVKQDDSLDGFEILEHILEELFDPKLKRIAAISSVINKKKGPRRPKRKLP